MSKLALMRHGPTEWNLAGKMQGRADISLRPEARSMLQSLRLPIEISEWPCLSSPLSRARETAEALGHKRIGIDQRLIEMDWGLYEGQTLDALRHKFGAEFSENESKGMDFRPEGGESPREVVARLLPFLAEIGAGGVDMFAVTHKGVMRALLSLATGWPMLGRAPVKFLWPRVQLFDVQQDGRLTLEQANILLTSVA